MKNVLHLSLASFATMFSINQSFAKGTNPSDCLHELNQLSCVRYVSNYDGDSFTFNALDIHPIFGEKVRFELSHFQAGALKSKDKCEKAKAIEAKALVKKTLKEAKRIDLVDITKTKSGKLRGDVLFDKQSLGTLLSKKSLAIPRSQDIKSYDWCK
jgi:endonuclease YncB( thermonuclease family)